MGNTPHTIKCPKCRKRGTHMSPLMATGEVGRKVQRQTLYARGYVLQRKIRCLGCGNVWMTTHPRYCPDHPLHARNSNRADCCECGKSKPVEEFHFRNKTLSTRNAYCKDCHLERMRRYSTEWKSNPEFLRRRAAISRKSAASHKTEVTARDIVSNGLRRGTIVPLDRCERCEHDFSEFRREAHHEDYDKPLGVEWLCSRCHGLTVRTS